MVCPELDSRLPRPVTVASYSVGVLNDPILEALDPDQRQVAESVEGPVVVIAGAGTGKTRAITHRIAHAAHVGAADPRRTLAVTFTTRAAGEMRGRLHELGVSGVQARTFHSAALKQVQFFWPRAYGSELPPLTDSRFGLLAEATARTRGATRDTTLIRDVGAEVSWAKVSNVTPGDYPALARSQSREVADLTPAQVAGILNDYESIKRERGVIDFEDILLCTVAMMHEHPEIAAQIRERYQHFTVDEYQDVSPLQQSLLMAWLGDRDDVCVVGDPAQSIHSYAGARPDFLTGFHRRHPGARQLHLTRDYRSTPQVVDLANKVLNPPQFARPANPGLVLVAQRAPGPEPTFEGHATDVEEAQAIGEWFTRLNEQGVEWREMAVLFRINAQAPVLEATFAEMAIPYLVRGTERFYERGEIRQALRLLTSHAANTPDDPGVASVRAILAGAGWSETPPAGSGQTRERWESLAALVELATELAAGLEQPTLAHVVEALTERAARQQAPVADGVTIATLHSAKGLEWDAVAIAGVAEGSIPFALSTSPEALGEERRLLYVGITRAREHLRISWSRTGGPGRGGRQMSRFLVGFTPGILKQPSAATQTGRSRRTSLNQRCRVCDEPLGTAAARKIGRHQHCESSYDESLLVALKEWRKQAADGAPAFVVFTDATLVAIAEALPGSSEELLEIAGVGPRKLERYGDDVLEILEQHRS